MCLRVYAQKHIDYQQIQCICKIYNTHFGISCILKNTYRHNTLIYRHIYTQAIMIMTI